MAQAQPLGPLKPASLMELYISVSHSPPPPATHIHSHWSVALGNYHGVHQPLGFHQLPEAVTHFSMTFLCLLLGNAGDRAV